MDALIGLATFGLFAVLWVAFGVALVASQGSLDAAWEWWRGLPVIAQGMVALLLLPVAAGLWIWETSWPLIVRLLLVGGVAFANLWTFFPRSLFGGRL